MVSSGRGLELHRWIRPWLCTRRICNSVGSIEIHRQTVAPPAPISKVGRERKNDIPHSIVLETVLIQIFHHHLHPSLILQLWQDSDEVRVSGFQGGVASHR